MKTPMSPPLRLLACLGLVPLAAGCRFAGGDDTVRASRDAVSPTGRVEAPHAAPSLRGGLLVVWGAVREDGSADIAFARAGEDGTVSPAARVNAHAGTAVAGRQVGPRVAELPDGTIVVSWIDRSRDAAGDVVIARSEDGGRTFGAPVRVNDDTGDAGQEYHDLEVLPDGDVVLVWLDERDAPPAEPNQKEVYFARSRDGAKSFETNHRVTESARGVCPCCRPDLDSAPDGTVCAVFRDHAPNGLLVRLATLRGGDVAFAPPVSVSTPWRYDACPVDGPAVAAGAGGDVLVAWMDGTPGEESLQVARSGRDGRGFEPEGSPRHGARRPALLDGPEGGFVAAWEDRMGRVWIERFGAKGDHTGEPFLLSDGGGERLASSVVLVASRGGVHAFWTEERQLAPAPEALLRGAGIATVSDLWHARVLLEEGRLAASAARALTASGSAAAVEARAGGPIARSDACCREVPAPR